ncbi:AMP-binding protein, partial [Pseudomonas aeruginosa]|uniref:AMP-binding protein n=1 Tax=Pseudomonas aeruginosa TaxID=287 RepID=UPI00397AD412
MRGDRRCLTWEPFEGDGQSWSYGEFRQALRCFASGLQARGVRPGDRILVHLDNCPESLIAWLGLAAPMPALWRSPPTPSPARTKSPTSPA